MTFRSLLPAIAISIALAGPTAEAPAGHPAITASALIDGDGAPARSSPFEAVRWTNQGTPEVRFAGVWYEPRSIHGVAVDEIVRFCGTTYPGKDRKRFEEDLVEAMKAMGHALPSKVSLVLRSLPDGKEITIPDAVMSEANRQAIREARAKEAAAANPPPLARTPSTLSRAAAMSVVDRLDEVLRTTHSYTVAKGLDPRQLLGEARAAIDASNEADIPSIRLIELLRDAVAPIGDGHAEIDASALAEGAMHLPATLASVPAEGPGRVAVLAPDERRLLDPAHPFLVAIDGVPCTRLMEAMSRSVAAGSPQLVERRTLRLLHDIGAVRSRLGIDFDGPRAQHVELTLSNADGATHAITLPLRADPPRRPSYATAPTEPAPGIRYVRIASMTDDAKEVADVRRACLDGADGADAAGLIIDLRGNGGGSRALIFEIGQRLLPAGAKPIVFNAARPLRLPDETEPALRERLDSRFLRSTHDPRFSAPESEAVEAFLTTFTPSMLLDDRRYHSLHVGVLSPAAPEEPRLAGRIAVLMDAGCFSATDIFLCALKEIPGVTLIGMPSSGGSGLTRRHDLGHGVTARLSTMVSFQPSGELLDGRGVAPDILVPPGLRDVTGNDDAMLAKAIEVLRPAR